MQRTAESSGPAYLRTYRSLEGVVPYERFVEVCLAQDLARPSKRMFEHIRRLYRDGQSNYVTINAHDQIRKARRVSWTIKRVEALLRERHPESERLDFKQQIQGDSTTKKPWAAMANSGGGDILYGIAEVNSEADQVKRISFDGIEERIELLNSTIDPPVELTVTRIPMDGDDGGVLWVRVAPAAPGIVHLVDHRAPIRSGTTTTYMTSEELRRWIREAKRPSSSNK